MFKLIKNIINLLPWYLRPTYIMEIVPELIKEDNNSKIKNHSKISTQKENEIHKIGLEEIIYGLSVIFILTIIRSHF